MTTTDLEHLEQLVDDIRTAMEILEEEGYTHLQADMHEVVEALELVIEDEA